MRTKVLLLNVNKALLFLAVLIILAGSNVKANNSDNMKKKILFVVTSHNQKGNTGEFTGFYLSEVSHPWHILVNAGYEIDFVSPKGGKAPIDGFNLGDAINKEFWNDLEYRNKIENTLKPCDINADDYIGIHYAGGHGAMWDFKDNVILVNAAVKIYEKGGIISAVCHGPAGLLNIRLSDGKYLIAGKKINAFTNEEETAVMMDKVVPFLLESKLIERGAILEKSGLWQPHVVVDQRLITGQNLQSARVVGEAVLQQLKDKEITAKLTRYEVKAGKEEQFRNVMAEYVKYALAKDNNIMSEAYFEQEQPSILWLMERWKSKADLQEFSKSAQAKALQSYEKEALVQTPKIYHLNDLEPLTKEQWRRSTKNEDSQLIVILFVDAKKGTQQKFKTIYHEAMPKFRSEPGVVTYQLSEIAGEATQFVTYEKFRSQDAFQYHLNFPPIKPVIEYLETSIKKPPFQDGLHNLIEFAPLIREE